MRIINRPQGISNETIQSKHFARFAMSRPEVLAQVATLWRDETTAFSSIFADRGMTVGDYSSATSKGYKVVGSREVRWAVEGLRNRIGNFVKPAVCEAYPTKPGYKQSEIKIYVDTDWFSPRDVLELADGRTLVYVYSNAMPRQITAGVWEYKVKVVTGLSTDYVDPELLAEGQDVGIGHNMYEEMSETAYEKYTFHGETGTFMTIMRMKYSMSGTAEAMKTNNQVWIEHNGSQMWMTHAQMEMLRRWAEQREHALFFGKTTVDKDGKTLMTLENGAEVTSGDGLMNQGDGVWKMPYAANTLSKSHLDTILMNMVLTSSSFSGQTDVAIVCGKRFYDNFQELMYKIAGTENKVVVGEGSGKKGIDMDYDYYKLGGIRLFPRWHKWFDRFDRPGGKMVDASGNRLDSHRAIFVSLGNLAGQINKPMVELLALGDRAVKTGTVNGINKGGEMANSVDGMHSHILSETGIANRDINAIAELFVPYTNSSKFYVSRNTNY